MTRACASRDGVHCNQEGRREQREHRERADAGLRSESLHPVGWFAVWLAVGVALAFSAVAVLSFGLFVFPFAATAAVLLIVRHHFDRSAWGLLCGMGFLSLYVAYVQRKGPGAVSWNTATAGGTDTYMDPRPWLVAGLLLIVVGVVAFLWHKRCVATGEERQQL